MTPAEALAKARALAPNVTGHVAMLFAHAAPSETDRVAARLAEVIGEATGEPWPAGDVAALAVGLAQGPLIKAPRIHTDGDGIHRDDAGRRYEAVDVDGELTYRPQGEPDR